MQRVHCPRHDEKTPSVVVYDSHGWCFGGCGNIPLSELDGVDGARMVARPPPANLHVELERIKALPLAGVRGLSLPVDGDSYYVVWPGDAYYKRRKFIAGDGPKYLCPRGHQKPVFVPWIQPKADTLAIVEGELNALSLAELKPAFSVCSPGGCGDFDIKKISKCYQIDLTYKRYLVIVDRDTPGLKAALTLKAELLPFSPYIDIILMKRDCNELLVAGELAQEAASWLNKNGSVSIAATRLRG